MSSLISRGERERVNIRRGLGAGGDTTGPPAAGNGYGWGVETPKPSAAPAKASASGQRPGAGFGTVAAGGAGGRGAMASAVGGGPAAVPTDDPLVVKRLTSQVLQPPLCRLVEGQRDGETTMLYFS